MILDTIKEILSIFSTTASTFILITGAALLIYSFKIICNKLGITINDTAMAEIIGIVSQVIKYLDQKFVDVIKKNSPDGTLTDYQKEIIKEKCVNMIKDILSSEQIELLIEKYNMNDIDMVLDILIESNIKDARANKNETIVINETEESSIVSNDDNSVSAQTYAPTEEEIESLSLCPGDCYGCSLTEDCCICRLH